VGHVLHVWLDSIDRLISEAVNHVHHSHSQMQVIVHVDHVRQVINLLVRLVLLVQLVHFRPTENIVNHVQQIPILLLLLHNVSHVQKDLKYLRQPIVVLRVHLAQHPPTVDLVSHVSQVLMHQWLDIVIVQFVRLVLQQLAQRLHAFFAHPVLSQLVQCQLV
jgi:hypothetical protein